MLTMCFLGARLGKWLFGKIYFSRFALSATELNRHWKKKASFDIICLIKQKTIRLTITKG